MKALILGSAGQIGQHLREYLNKQGIQTTPFDLTDDPQQDLRKQDVLDPYLEDSDFVFFLAFDVGGSKYLSKYQNTYDFIQNNTRIIHNTFSSLKKHKVPFIYTSTQMASMSYSAYGSLKGLGEWFTHAIDGIVVKFWNVYGVERDFEKSHVITDFVRGALLKKKINMLTDGKEERQFLYADDCCECLLELAKQYDAIPRNKELHITSFDWANVLRITEIISTKIEGTEVIPSTRTDEVQQNAKNEPDPFILKYWQPKTSLKEGVKKIIYLMKQGIVSKDGNE